MKIIHRIKSLGFFVVTATTLLLSPFSVNALDVESYTKYKECYTRSDDSTWFRDREDGPFCYRKGGGDGVKNCFDKFGNVISNGSANFNGRAGNAQFPPDFNGESRGLWVGRTWNEPITFQRFDSMNQYELVRSGEVLRHINYLVSDGKSRNAAVIESVRKHVTLKNKENRMYTYVADIETRTILRIEVSSGYKCSAKAFTPTNATTLTVVEIPG